MKTIHLICQTLVFLLLSHSICAQVRTDSELFLQLKNADSLLFELGFNQCDTAVLQQLMHKDLEFLHDQGGIQDRDAFFKAHRENICGNPDNKPIRKRVEGSLMVYPMFDNGKLYGAIQMGTHEFYLAEPGKPLKPTGKAKFIHTWLLVDGQWQLYRVISYDHQPSD